MKKMEKKRSTLWLPPATIKALRIMCAEREITISGLVEMVIKIEIDKYLEEKAKWKPI